MCSTVSSALLSIYGVCDLLCLHLHIQLLDYHLTNAKKVCVFSQQRYLIPYPSHPWCYIHLWWRFDDDGGGGMWPDWEENSTPIWNHPVLCYTTCNTLFSRFLLERVSFRCDYKLCDWGWGGLPIILPFLSTLGYTADIITSLAWRSTVLPFLRWKKIIKKVFWSIGNIVQFITEEKTPHSSSLCFGVRFQY